MMLLIDDPYWHRWLCEKIEIRLHQDQASSLMFFHSGPLGGFLFERYTGRGGSMHVHFAGAKPGWLRRGILQTVASYVFMQAECEFLFGQVNSKDLATRSIDERIGFTHHSTLENYFPDADLIVYRMRKGECPWLPGQGRGGSVRNGEEVRRPAVA